MKSLIGLMIGITFSFGSQIFAESRFLPEVLSLLPEAAHVPPGFDSNDKAEIVITGNFMNTCYQVGPTTVDVNHALKQIRINNSAYYYDGVCHYTLMPYQKTIDLGILEVGKYEIQFLNRDGDYHPISSITVAESSNTRPDNHYYAPIHDVEYSYNHGKPTVKLMGVLRTTCLVFDTVTVMNRTPDVVEVLPIVEYVEKDECPPVERPPFVREVKLPLPDGEPRQRLIHVRAMNGQAINKVVFY